MATFDDISKQRREAKKKRELSTGNSSTVFDDIASRRRAYRNKLNEEEQKKNKEENRLRINKWFNDAQNAIETADLYMSDNSYGAMMDREKNINSVLDEISAHSGFVKAYIKKREGTENGEKLSNLFNNYKNTIDSYKEKASEDTNIAKYSLSAEQVKRLLNPADSFNLIKETDFSNNEKVELLKPVDGWLSNNLYSAEELDKNQKQKEYDDYINRVEKEESIQQYAEKYKNSKLEQRKNAMIHSSDPLELDWLNKHLYENSSSKELRLEQEELRNNFSNYNQEYNRIVDEASSVNKKHGFDYDGELKKMEAERNNFSAKINELDGLIERRAQEENEDKYYNDIISDNAKAGTIVQQYYNVVNGITPNNNVADSYSEMQGIVENDEERKNRISAEFEKLKEQGIDADKMLKYYSRIHEREERAKFLDRVAGNSKKDPVFSSLGSVVDNTVGSVWDAGRYVGAWADKTFLGGDGYIDPNSTNVKKARVVREAVSEDMNGFGKFLYQTGMSMADFTAMLPMNLFPGGQAASLAILSSSAGVDSANTVLENGGTLDKAILSGIASGTAEAFFERFSLEQLKAFKQSGGSEVKDLVLNVLKGSFTEGSEEVATEISNAITDQIINGDMSSLSLQYQNYIDSGMTEDEANKQIAIDFGSQVGLSFAGGALSGGVLNIGVGGINYTNNKVNDNKTTSAVGSLLNGQGADENTSADELITLGKDLDSTSKAHKLATKIETDTANGNKVSDKKMGKLFNAVMRDTSTYTERTYKQETKNLNKQETAVVDKIIKGKSLDKAEVKISQNDNVASAVKSIIKSRSKAHSTQKSAVDTVNNAIHKAMGVISDDNTSDIDVKVSKSHGFVINDKPYSGALNIVDTDPKTRTVVYETENSDIVTSDNIEFPTHEEGAINYLASRYNANTAQKFVNDYKQGQNIEKYAREWNLYQNYGRLVVPLTQENMNNRTILTDEQMYSAYDSGIESYKSHYQTQKILAQKAKQSSNYSFKHGSFDDSAVRNLHLNKEQRSTLKGIKAFAELTGLNIEMFASKSDNNGDYIGEQGSWNAETKTLRLDINSGKRSVNNANINHAITNTMAHELTHTAAEGKYFGELRDTLAKIINDSEIAEATFKDLVDNQLNNIEKNNKYKSLTEDEKLNLAEEEAVAEACEIMLKNTSIFDTLVSENKNLAQRILDSLKAFIKYLQEFINKNTSALTYEGSILEQALNASKEAYAKLQDVWDKAVISGVKAVNAKTNVKEQKNNTVSDNNIDVKYSIRNTKDVEWVDQINNYYLHNGFIKHSDTLVIEKNIPDYLSTCIDNLPLALPIRVISKAQSKKDVSHSVSNSNIKKIQNGIRNAVATIYNHNRNSILFITDIMQGEYPLVVAFELNSKFDNDLVHKCTSIHLRTNLNSYLSNLNGTTVFVKNKNEFNALCREVNILDRLQKDNKLINVSLSQANHDVKYQFGGQKAEVAYDTSKKMQKSGFRTVNAKTEQKNNTADNSNVKNSSRYSYDKLINKPDMKITVIDDSIEYTPNASTRKSIVDDAVKNAAKVGYINTNGNVAVNVKDIDTDIIISKKALRHGIGRRLNVLAPITLNVGEILHNSIKINEMTPKNSNVDKSYILIGTAKNKVNEPYIVTFVVNRSTNELTSVDVLYSINTKTEPVGSLSPDVPTKVDYLTGSKISISNLLDYVNKYYADILPEDVLKYYNYDTRPEGKLGKSVLYQFGGRKAEGADVSLLDKAERMEKDGSDSETIRQETGWFRGYDGKWRFEIDDSKMTFVGLTESDIDKIFRARIIKNRMNELEKKVVNDTATRAEENEYYELDDQLIETQHSGTLDDYITHPTLFKAYPQLKSIKVNFDTDILENANYNSSTNTITLNARLRNAELKNKLVHEIQHAIQNIENFARGSTIEHWENSNSDNPYGDYYNTAGEIEARDAQKRLDYNAEQRKNIRPDIDREDVVFADSEVNYSTKKSFNEQVDDALEGKLNKRNALFVSKTSDVLLGIGMKQLPMLYTQSHLNNAIKPKTINNTGAHGLTVEQVKYMPKIIKHPAIILDSLSSNEDVVLISDKLDNDGAPIILIVHPNGKGVYELITQPSNFIKSYYGKDNDFKGYIERAISTEKILYINKDKSQSLYQQIGLQLPNGFNKLGFDKIIQQSNNIVNDNSIQKNLDNPDIRYQSRNSNNDYSKALNKDEWASFYSSLQKGNQRNAFRIGDNGILIPDKNTSENYKLVCYEGDSNNAYITAVYKLENYDYNIHSSQSDASKLILELERNGYNDKQTRTILRDYASLYQTVFKRYNNKSGRFVKLTREGVSNRENVGVEPDRTGVFDDAGQGVSNGRLDEDVKFQQRSDGGFSNRELLSNALDDVVQNGEEKSVLKAYKEGISQINELEERLKMVNSQIRDISFTKGSDRSQLPKLKEQQKQLRQRIDRKDSLLLKIEAMKPMQSLIANAKTKAIQKYRAKANEQIAKIRESKNAKIAKEIKHRQEAVQKIRDSRDKKEYINKIKKSLKDIDKLINRSKADRTVKQDLRNPATKMISTSMALFDDTISNADIVRRGVTYATPEEQELLKKYLGIVGQTDTELSDADKRKIYQLNSDLKELFKREREIINRTTVKNALTELCDAYKSIKSSSESYIRDSFDENIVEAIDNFKEEVGGTVVKDMSLSQIKEYHKIVTMMLTTIRRANKLFSKNMKATCEQTATDVMNEIQNIRKTKESHNIILKWVSEFNWNNLKPIYAFRFIGSKTFENIFWNVQRGEIKWYIDLSEAKSFKENCESKYNYKSFDFKKKFEFESTDGNKFNLDLNQMMDIYAASRRPQALQHLLKGGFTFEKNSPDGKLKVKTGAKAYPLTMDTIQNIANELSENEKGYAEEMQKYLSEVMAKKGNEVSMALYGVEMFNEDTYWSISSSDTFLQIAENETTSEFTLKHNGFTKSTVRNASNPIVLRGFEENWCNHVNQMSLYHALTLPLEDFTKVFNYNTGVRTNEDNPTAVTGVRSVIKGSYGNAAEKYIRQFLRDLNGGIMEASRVGIADNMIALSKKAAVLANFSVTLQQPSAVFRAMAYVDAKYFLPEPNKLVRLQNHHKDWEQIKKYAPIAGIKEMGLFDTGMSKGVLDWLSSDTRNSKVEKVQNFIDDKISRGPALADEYAWIKLWHAIQRETRAKYGLKIGSEENLAKSGERFNEVVHLTQVYDSVLSRSGAMRSKQTFDKMATAFMAEPTTIMNMAFDAFVQLNRNGKSGIKQFAKTISAVAVSIIANDLLSSLANAGRDDDEDETYGDKYSQAFVNNLRDAINPLNYYPFFRDIMSVIEGYTTERMDMSLISDFVISIKKLMKEDGTSEKNIFDFIGCLSNLSGIPVKNVIRDFNSIINTYKTLTTASKDPITSLELSMTAVYQEAYNKYWRDGYTEDECDKKAQTSVKAKIRKKLRPVYLEALKNQDSATVANIRRYMRDSGFYESLNGVDNVLKGWREKSDEEEEREQRAEERK